MKKQGDNIVFEIAHTENEKVLFQIDGIHIIKYLVERGRKYQIDYSKKDEKVNRITDLHEATQDRIKRTKIVEELIKGAETIYIELSKEAYEKLKGKGLIKEKKQE